MTLRRRDFPTLLPRNRRADEAYASATIGKEDAMATACLFIGWDRPIPGKDGEAYGYLMRDVTEQFQMLQKQGWFESFDFVGLTPHGGDLNGFILLRGERAKLDELRRTDEFEAFAFQLMTMFDRVGVVPGLSWEGIQKVMARRRAQR